LIEEPGTARLSGRQRREGREVQTRFEQVSVLVGIAQLVEQRIRKEYVHRQKSQ
jgi:hypothetical protein